MATEAQIRANQQNAQHSTGPTSEAGRAASSRNHTRHGFTGAFFVLTTENQTQFTDLLNSLRNEHQPSTIIEALLVESMAQSFWLVQRAIAFQNECLADAELSPAERDRQLALFLRYQTTHQRAFHRFLNDLLKLRSEKRKARLDEAALSKRAEDVKIGFESQRQKQATLAIRESAEKRKQELHHLDVMLAEAKIDHQTLLNSAFKTPIQFAQRRKTTLSRAETGFNLCPHGTLVLAIRLLTTPGERA